MRIQANLDLSDGVHKMKRIIFWAYIIMPVTYVSCLLVAFFKCIPFDHQWQINPNPGSKLNNSYDNLR